MMAYFLGLWTSFCSYVAKAGLPVVCCYHLVCGNYFLNMADSNAVGLEKAGNILLAPVHYAFNGKIIKYDPTLPDQFLIESRFTYTDKFPLKICAAAVATPISLVVGSIVKGFAYLSHDVRERHDVFAAWRISPKVGSHLERYRSLGMAIDEILDPLGGQFYQRRPGDENNMKGQKEALRDITGVLKKNKIIFWVDCGTCLGAYRYGGSIPWDDDIDLGILQEDFDNAKNALMQLDPARYVVQDWSGRDKPKSYLKVYDRKSNALIDLYNFRIDPRAHQVCLVFSNENSIFLSKNWKTREGRYVLPTSFDIVFPLRKAIFDGVEIYVPNQTKKYLQMRYGENLNPSKIYDPNTGKYEKDLSHPYWKLPCAK